MNKTDTIIGGHIMECDMPEMPLEGGITSYDYVSMNYQSNKYVDGGYNLKELMTEHQDYFVALECSNGTTFFVEPIMHQVKNEKTSYYGIYRVSYIADYFAPVTKTVFVTQDIDEIFVRVTDIVNNDMKELGGVSEKYVG